MKTTFLVLALIASISIQVAVVAKSSESFRIAKIPPIGLPPIKPNSVVISTFNQPCLFT